MFPIVCSFLPNYTLSRHNKMSTFNELNIVQTVDNIRHIFTYWIYLSVLCCHCIQWKDSDKIRSIFLFCLQTAQWIIMNFGNSDFTKISVMKFHLMYVGSLLPLSYEKFSHFPLYKKWAHNMKYTYAVYDWNISDVCM